MTAIDERLGLPSASEYPRIRNCPGYLNLKRDIGAQVQEDPPEWTKSGQRIAAAFEGTVKFDALSDDEQKSFQILAGGRRAILGSTFGDDLSWNSLIESRLWLLVDGQKVFSGKLDFAAITETQFTIVDDKSGHLEVEKAHSNLQLRALAVLLREQVANMESGFVAINQPWFRPPYSLAFYGPKDLDRAKDELLASLAVARNPNAARRPGAWCKYCPCAKAGRCAEARGQAIEIGRQNPTAIGTNEDLGQFLVHAHPSEDVIRAVRDEVKRRLIDGQQVPGWRLKAGDVRTFISDPETVFDRAYQLGISRPAFMTAVQIDKTRLKELIKTATKRRGSDLDRALAELLKGCVDERSFGPSIERDFS